MNRYIGNMIGAMSAAVTACMLFAAFPAAADGVKMGRDDSELNQTCINIAGTKYAVNPRENPYFDYEAEILNNISGFTDITVALSYPAELEVIPNEDDEPATGGDMTARWKTEASLDAENRQVIFSCHCDKANMHEGMLFSVRFQLPVDAKNGDKWVLKPEVLTLKNQSGDLPFAVLDGYIEAGTYHDDYRFDKGDMDLTHGVNVADAQLILKEYVKSLSGQESALREDHRLLIDIDENGRVDVADAQLLLKYCTEQTAMNDVTWEQLLGEKPKYPSVHITSDTFDYVWGLGKYAKNK